VLACRPVQAEARFSYAGLADLLGGAADNVLPVLPPIQRRALESALLIGDTEVAADDRAVAAAFLGAVRLLAAEAAPVCLAIDDLQWLDAASLAALQFALPRLDHGLVAALLTVRGNPPPWLRPTLPDPWLVTVWMTGLSVGAIYELFRVRLGVTFPRPILIRLWETSSGNPFFALELAAALRRLGVAPAPDEPLPIPATLDELLRERLAGLDAGALEAARVVAAAADPTTELVEAALGGSSDSWLAEALDARILELDDHRLRFTHPLLGSAVASRETPSRRRALHSRLAKVVPTAEERARHLALASSEPDDEIASILDAAATSARVRGAPGTAAELAEKALRLTPQADAAGVRRRRLFAAARHHDAGDSDRAIELLERAQADAAPGREAAEVLIQLAAVQASPREAEALYRQALGEADGDDTLGTTIHLGLASLMQWGAGIERGLAHAELAARAASRTDDVALRCRALATHADWHFRAGRGIPREQMDEAIALEQSLAEGPLVDGPTEALCHQLMWSVELDPARELLLELREVRKARDDVRGEAFVLWELGFLEWRAGNWAEADRYAAGGLELRTQLGRALPHDEFPAATIAAHRGRIDEARARSRGAAARAEAAGIQIAQSGHGWVLGFVELSQGNPAAALDHLRRSYGLRNTFMYEPGQRIELGDLLEALIATGELDEADETLATWEPRAAERDRAWALAILARCRGLLLAARGDLDGAFASFERARAEHARTADPFHHARTLLALGRTQRRAKRRAAARTTLEEAVARFETLGAPLWAEQGRAELARIGGRAPSRDELTEAERRIAALVAEGHTNREVAAELFLTVRSVETALTRIYRKVGVRSRAELAHRLTANS
jgi:DNA-binding CsgD family transcriptional regulator